MIFSDDGYTVLVDGVKVELLRKEFLLLKFLYMNNGRCISARRAFGCHLAARVS